MTCTLHRVAATEVDFLLEDPARVGRILFADDENWTVTRPKGLVGFLLRLTPLTIESATPKEPLTEDLDRIRETECDLEGAWHGLHFLFTGTAWEGAEPACYLVRGGDEVGDDDLDQAPRLLRPELARSFNSFLAGLSDEELRNRYDRRRMTELRIDQHGLSPDSSAPDDVALSLLLESFHELRVFTDRAAAAGDGLIVHLA